MPGDKRLPLSIILKAVDKATAPIRAVAKTATNLGKKFSIGVTAPIVGIGFAATRAFGEFEQGMSNVSTLVDAGVESMDEMSKKVLAIGRRTPVAVSQLTEALFDVRSAGVDASSAMNVLEKSAQLGVAGLGSSKEAVDLVTSSLNAFQLEGEEANKVYDLIFKTTKFGKTTIAGLAQGFGAVAGTVAATGTELDEYLASVSALTTTGLPAAVAHTQMRSAMVKLSKQTPKTTKLFKSLGVKGFKELIKNSGGLVNAFEAVKGEMKGDSDALLSLLGSAEAYNAVMSLTGAQSESFRGTLEDMRTGANAVDEAFKKQSKTIKSTSQQARNSLTSMAVSIGEVLAPSLGVLAENVSAVAGWFSSLSKRTQGWIIGVAAAVAAIGPALAVFGKLAMVLAGASKAVLFFTRVMIAMKLAGPIAAITLLTTAAIMLRDEWDEIEQFFKLLWGGVVKIFQRSFDVIDDLIGDMVRMIRDLLDNVGLVAGFLTNVSGSEFDDVGAKNAGSIAEGRAKFGQRLNAGKSARVKDPPIQKAKVEIEVKNAPPGTRTNIEPGSTADVDVRTGIALVAP